MPCFHPKRVALDEYGRLDWSRHLTSWVDLDGQDVVLVPCRVCLGCKASEARDWSIRCYHEAQFHTRLWRDPVTRTDTVIPNSVMLTLTYDDEHLPEDRTLRHSDVQKFFKDVRNRRGSGSVRYFMCGEYGGVTHRPHYHILLFGEDFSDRYQEVTSDGQRLSQSYELDEIWFRGRATIDDLNFQTARYVAGYVNKPAHTQGNFTGPLAESLVVATGEVRVEAIAPEYRTMSKRPGLGLAWIERNYERVYPADHVVINGHEYPPPGYYDRWLKVNHPSLYYDVQSERLDKRIQAQTDWTPNRCASAEAIALNRVRKDVQ